MPGPSEDAEALAQAIRRVLPTRRDINSYYSFVDLGAVHRLIRLAVYANDEAEFIKNRNLCDKTFGLHRTVMFLATTFYDVPLEADWVASRHPVIQAPLLEAKLNAFIVTGLGGPEVLETIALCRKQQEQKGFGGLRAQLLRYDLLAGRLDEVRDAAKTVEDTAGRDGAGDSRQSLEGAVAFLEGRNEAALLHYRDALKLRRKRLGKRRRSLNSNLPEDCGIASLQGAWSRHRRDRLSMPGSCLR